MDLASHLEKFRRDFTSEDWWQWRDVFRDFLRTKEKVQKLDADDKLAYLRIIGGVELVKFIKALGPVDAVEDNCEGVMQQLDNHFKKVQNPIKEKFEFRKMKQYGGEGIKDFALRLREQANKCSFDDVEGEILQQLVVGTIDIKLQQSALRKNYAKVQEFVDDGLVNESIGTNDSFMASTSICRVKQTYSNDRRFITPIVERRDDQYQEPGPSGQGTHNRTTRGRGYYMNNRQVQCHSCRKFGHHSFYCNASKRVNEIRCYACGNFGHIASRCPDSRDNAETEQPAKRFWKLNYGPVYYVDEPETEII